MDDWNGAPNGCAQNGWYSASSTRNLPLPRASLWRVISPKPFMASAMLANRCLSGLICWEFSANQSDHVWPCVQPSPTHLWKSLWVPNHLIVGILFMKEILDHLMWTISNNVPFFLVVSSQLHNSSTDPKTCVATLCISELVAQLYVLQTSSTFPTPLSCAGPKGTCPNPSFEQRVQRWNESLDLKTLREVSVVQWLCVCTDENHRRTLRFARDPMTLSITPSWNWVPRQKTTCVGSGLRLKHEHLVQQTKQANNWNCETETFSRLQTFCWIGKKYR